MQPDVHRKFIHRPNVYLWDRDFNTMKAAGINMLRTGIWTSFKSIMPSDGFISEEKLRVFDAMFLTAKKYDLPIVFNFFAFSPEMWSGKNPYLDPKSVQAQKRYINAIVTRHRNSKGVMWDLINEPSVSNPKKLWKTRPNGDVYELMEWRNWLKEKHETIEALQEKWNYSSDSFSDFGTVGLPKEEEFFNNFNNLQHGLKVHDYYLFTQHVFNKWAKEMYDSIRAVKANQLITVGQDEGASGQRSHPFFYQEVIDYTCNHPWWQIDDLYWDSIFCKSPNKPNLSQETGIMNVNDPNGKGKLTEENTRDLLERKYAYAFAADNAGAIQWVWNINIHIDSLNESTIGAVRPDGGQKLEADVSYDFGKFMSEIFYIFEGRKEADVVVINPFANNFSISDHSIISTKKLTHCLAHNMSTSFKVYGEYYLDELKPEKLIILPSPRTLTNKAFNKVLACVEKGSVLYISGPFSYDEYWGKLADRSKTLGIETKLKAVCQEESIVINNQKYRVTFGELKRNWVDKEVEIETRTEELKVFKYGEGNIIWSPLPLEMNEHDEVIQKAYEYALDMAGVVLDFTWMINNNHGLLGKKLRFKKHNLYVFISELSVDKNVIIKDNEKGTVYKFVLPAQRIMMFVTDETGTVIKTYKDWQVAYI
ncbi:MAG TPA: beta-galactosidase [Lachnospiraceae bacterium]|nr:beta-galactosidase [Lachnospiraceae bacterium]